MTDTSIREKEGQGQMWLDWLAELPPSTAAVARQVSWSQLSGITASWLQVQGTALLRSMRCHLQLLEAGGDKPVHGGGHWTMPCLLLTDLVLIAHDVGAIVDQIPATHLHGCLSQQLLEDNTADDAGDWQALLHSWVEGVELDIPAQGGST